VYLTVVALTDSDSSFMFDAPDNTQISVRDYFLQKYNITLQ
jgi:hypothetical protein